MKKLLNNSYIIFFTVIFFFLDFISKYWVSTHLPLIQTSSQIYPYGGIGIFKNFLGIEFSIVHATNRGAAWGIFDEHQIILLIFRILLLCALIIFVLFYNRNKANTIPLALIIAGATGNILDYFFYGHVIDMFNFVFWGYNYPVFNIADSGICIAVVWLIFTSPSFKKGPISES